MVFVLKMLFPDEYLKDINNWEKVGKAHSEYFKEIKPATTLEVTRLIHPELLVEIEAGAVIILVW